MLDPPPPLHTPTHIHNVRENVHAGVQAGVGVRVRVRMRVRVRVRLWVRVESGSKCGRKSGQNNPGYCPCLTLGIANFSPSPDLHFTLGIRGVHHPTISSNIRRCKRDSHPVHFVQVVKFHQRHQRL